MNRKEFEDILRDKFGPEDQYMIMCAYRMAKYGHRNQERDGGERYFEHPRRVALILINEFGIRDADMVAAALLHDIIEDSFLLLYGDIRKLFGDRAACFVKDLTKDGNKEKYFPNLLCSDAESQIIKAADRLDNLRDLKNWAASRKQKYLTETERYILKFDIKEKYLSEIRKICSRLKQELQTKNRPE